MKSRLAFIFTSYIYHFCLALTVFFLLTPLVFARDNATPKPLALTPEQLQKRLTEYDERVETLTPLPDSSMVGVRNEILLKTVPPAKPVGAYDISMIAALAAVTDQLTCISMKITDCENLPVASQAAPFAMSFTRTNERYPDLSSTYWGPVEGQQKANEAAESLLKDNFSHVEWSCISPNPFFTPQGTSLTAREKIEEFGEFLVPLYYEWRKKTVTWEEVHPKIISHLSEIMGKPSSQDLTRFSMIKYNLPQGIISAEVIKLAECYMASRPKALGVIWWPSSTLPKGMRNRLVLPLLRELVASDIMPLLEICTTPEDSAGHCDHSITLAVTGIKEVCNETQEHCSTAIRVVNTFDLQWAEKHPGGWISFSYIEHQLATNPLRDSTITWYQTANKYPWTKISEIKIDTSGFFNDQTDGKLAYEAFIEIIRPRHTSLEEELKEKINIGSLKALQKLKPIDFKSHKIKSDSLIQLSSIPSDRNQGVLGICYSASVSALGEQLYCRENHISDCQSIPEERQTSVINSPRQYFWAAGSLKDGGLTYNLLEALSDDMIFNLKKCVRSSALLETATIKGATSFLKLKYGFDEQIANYKNASSKRKKVIEMAMRNEIEKLVAISLTENEMLQVLNEHMSYESERQIDFETFLFRILVKKDCFENLIKKDSKKTKVSRDKRRWPKDKRELPDMSKFSAVIQFLLQHNIMPDVTACFDDEPEYANCNNGHSWAVKAMATICSTLDGTCFPAVQVMNWWGPEWQKERNGGWVRMDVFKELASKDGSPITWVISYNLDDPELPDELEN